ncbi:hypothetical protein KR026_011988 [Drosophila bipectinata]|nr:hypothetical protein KR026_011988 [Drosophila bipectinata]
MDRRNGGDPLAPPRPPKLLPRVHRPRAPEPTLSGADLVATPATLATPTATATATHNNNSQQQLSINPISNNNINNNISNNNNNNNTISIIPASATDFDDYQIHHLTFLPQRPSSLSRNSSTASASTTATNSGSGSGSVTGSSSSFTRRRPPAPAPVATVAVPLSGTIHSHNNNNNNNTINFLSHFQSADPAAVISSSSNSNSNSNTTTAVQGHQPPASPVTLAQPRPESERLTNEYVDTPLQHATRSQHPAGQQDNGQTTTHHLLLLPQRQQHHHHLHPHHHQHQHQHQHHHPRLAATQMQGMPHNIPIPIPGAGSDHTDGLLHSHLQQQQHATSKLPTAASALPASKQLQQQQPAIITKQPGPASKEHMHALEELLQQQPGGVAGNAIVMGGDPALLNPIVCPRCGRCRCEQCQSPRPLPQTWVCNKTCLCSAESVIDYASCLCCAKALFYHCARDNDLDCDDGNGTPCVDNPCSCGPYKRTQRWGWLGALSIFLPCLWFYWPMRGCMKLCEKCYGRFAGRGCRCQGVAGIGSTSSMLPIVPVGVNGSGNGGVMPPGAGNPGAGLAALSQANGKAIDHGCSAASRILRKGDLTPEKRLLDSSPDY